MVGTTDLSREFPIVIVELDDKVLLLLMCWAIEEELLGNEIVKFWIFVLDVWLCFGYGIILCFAVLAIVTDEVAVMRISG